MGECMEMKEESDSDNAPTSPMLQRWATPKRVFRIQEPKSWDDETFPVWPASTDSGARDSYMM